MVCTFCSHSNVFCQSAIRKHANHTISKERGGDYHTMASSQGVLSEGEKREKEKGSD